MAGSQASRNRPGTRRAAWRPRRPWPQGPARGWSRRPVRQSVPRCPAGTEAARTKRIDTTELLQPDGRDAAGFDGAGGSHCVVRRQPVQEPRPQSDTTGSGTVISVLLQNFARVSRWGSVHISHPTSSSGGMALPNSADRSFADRTLVISGGSRGIVWPSRSAWPAAAPTWSCWPRRRTTSPNCPAPCTRRRGDRAAGGTALAVVGDVRRERTSSGPSTPRWTGSVVWTSA